jgi:hypothetical protein
MVAPYQNIGERTSGFFYYAHLSVHMCLTTLAGPEVFLSVIHMEGQRVTLCLEFHPFYTAVYSYGGRNKQDSKQQFQQLKIVCAPARKSTGTSEPAWRLRLIGLPSESVLPHAIISWSCVLSWCSWSLMHTVQTKQLEATFPGIY